MSNQRGKTICFIDNSNIFHGQQAVGWRIDWGKFQGKVEEEGPIWQTYFFASEEDPPRAIQSAFYRYLKEELRWEVVLFELGKKTVTCDRCNQTRTVQAEKGADVGLAAKMLMLAFNKAYETGIVVTGDRDYLDTVKFIKNLGIRIEIIAWQGGMSSDLAAEASAKVKYLDDMRADIERV